jgi:hypothetical protein
MAARVAFDRALKHGVDPAALIEGARRYAGERAGQDPTYTKHPATWLRGGCWEDEPKPGAVIDPAGNVVNIQPRDKRETLREVVARRQAARERGEL